VIYLNADPTIHIVNLIFQELPIIPHAFNSVSPILLPLLMLPTRYMLLLLLGFEAARMVCFSVAVLLILVSQFQDAFDFQLDFFQKSVNSKLSQISLKHVSKCREIIIVRDTFNSSISFGPVIFLLLDVPLILILNYCIVKMYHDLSTPAWITILYISLVSMFMIKSIFNAGAAIEQASVKLLRSFHMKTKQLHGRDLRYVTKALKSIPVFSLYLGLPGYNIFPLKHSTTSSAFLFILDNTINLLLTF
jgi:hypothetical protein